MKNSVSDQSFYIESDDEDERVSERDGEEGNDSDSSDNSSEGSQQQNRPSSYTTTWPQSYR